jgi:hypothetical protein
MAMPDAASLIGIGISLFGAGFLVHAGFDGWLKMKKLELQSRDTKPIVRAPDAELAGRLARIEQIVELTAVEVERVAEAQRFVAMQIAEGRATALAPGRTPERVITPH